MFFFVLFSCTYQYMHYALHSTRGTTNTTIIIIVWLGITFITTNIFVVFFASLFCSLVFFFRLFESNAIITTSECNAGMSVLSAHKYWMINGLLLLFFKFFLWIFFSFARLLASLQFNACRWLSIDILILLYIFMLFFR